MYHMLRQFVALVETHSYTKASKRLYISQPALSKSIKSLENSFGGKLIERTQNGCYPTQYGKILYRHAKAIENEMQLLDTEMRQARLNMENHITIAYGILWQIMYSAEIILRIEESSNNEIVITGKSGPTELMIEELLKGQCDLFLGEIPNNLHTKLTGIPLIKSRHAIFAHEDHPLHQNRDRIRLDDLNKYKWIIFGSKEDLPGYEIPDQLMKNVEIQTIHDTNSMLTVIKILQNSKSLVLLPQQVGNLLEHYGIKELECQSLKFNSFQSGIIFRTENEDQDDLKMIIDVIKISLPEMQ